MSDFLRNLRSSHKKDTVSQRRSMDGHYYHTKDRRRMSDRRSTSYESVHPMSTSLDDLLPELIENSNQIIKYLQKKQEEDTLLLKAKIRHYESVATFLDNLNRLFSESPEKTFDGMPKATASYASGTHYTKDDILSIIQNMRHNGSTFSTIAEYLKDKGIPTFSGRGEWHAQTIHRLCK